ncbi:calpain-B-like [Antedon mediterranea]|uniref:calpain-B-like n=1 Tax=Antedon mediterranea TaxID=105859 RepID=UPI003AF9807E
MAVSTQVNTLWDQTYADLIADSQYSKDNLFEDPRFGACNESIFLKEDTFLFDFYERRNDIKWLRPKEILEGKQEAFFFKDGASFNEVILAGDEGLANASFMNALAGMTLVPSVLNYVCPEQSFKDNYKGIFRFRFWRFGSWYEIVIDDRLPTLDGKLMFGRCQSKDEFWAPLMEKALAKLLMRYEAMDCTFEIPEALIDLSGGTVERVQVSDCTEATLSSKLKMCRKTGSLVTATLAFGHSDYCGLKPKTLYILNGSVKKVMYNDNNIMCWANIIRVLSTERCEWTGPWGDESKEMKSLSAEIKEEFKIKSKVDGDFWMDIKDVLKRFKELRILHVPPELSEKESNWTVTEHFNKWQKGSTAMGRYEANKENFHNNPQYNIKVDDDGDLVVVSLMAVGRGRQETSWDGYNIGLDVYKTEDSPIDSKFLQNNKPLHSIVHKEGIREINLFMTLDPGNYVVIPSTFNKNKEIPFLLRFFAGYSSKTASASCITVYTPTLTKNFDDLDPMMSSIIESFFKEKAGADGLMDNSELDAFFAGWKKEQIIPIDISHETSAAIAALYDDDDSRTLSVNEGMAIGALSFYCDMTFLQSDKDNSKSLDASELRDALSRAGLKTSDTILQHLVSRYVGSDNKITYDEFFLMVSKLRYVIKKFEKLGGSNEKSVALTIEDLMEMCVKL